jgi:hypothetical protein
MIAVAEGDAIQGFRAGGRLDRLSIKHDREENECRPTTEIGGDGAMKISTELDSFSRREHA